MSSKMMLALLLLVFSGCGRSESTQPITQPAVAEKLIAKTYDSGFADTHDTYNGVSVASDGKVYYVLSSERFDVGGQVYSFDPENEKIEHVGDLTEACGEKDRKTIAQGKSHVIFYESGGKLYFATHIGYYIIKEGMETAGEPPPGCKPYPGGHFLSYDLKTRAFENLAIAPDGEGILSMTMDVGRGRLYGLTWPTGYFLRYDLATREMKNVGPVAERGESGKGPTYRTLCRALVVNPDDGAVYLTRSEGFIMKYDPDRDTLETMADVDLTKDYFGSYDPTSAGHMGYNWRQVFWFAPERMVYGVHGNSGYLFRFDPRVPKVEVLERLTSLPSKRSGMYDQFSYGYLGFTLGPDGRTIHYLTGGPIYVEGKRVEGKKSTARGESKGQENLHLVTYYIPEGRYKDHGPIFFENGDRPAYVNSIAVGKDGSVYTLSRITEGGKPRADLIRIRGPFK